VCAVNHICATVQTITDRPSHNGCKLQFHMPWIPLSGHPHLYLRIYVSMYLSISASFHFHFRFIVHVEHAFVIVLCQRMAIKCICIAVFVCACVCLSVRGTTVTECPGWVVWVVFIFIAMFVTQLIGKT